MLLFPLIMSVFMLSAEGDVPRVTREVLRQAIEGPSRRRNREEGEVDLPFAPNS